VAWRLLKNEIVPPPAMQMDWINHDIMDAHPDKVFLFGDNHQRRGMGVKQST
jgi:hypothetical protein